MTKPILDPELRDLEEELMRAGRDVRMSPELQSKTLAVLAAGAVGMTAASAAKASSLGWLSTKGGTLWAAGLVGAVGVAGAVVLTQGFSGEQPTGASPSTTAKPSAGPASRDARRRVNEPPKTHAVPSPVQLTEESDSREPAAEPDAPAATPQKRPPSERSEPAAASSPESGPSRLRQELSQLARVEAALEAGQPEQALSFLSEYRGQFPRRQLGLEAEVLTIQALYESGSVGAARKRAARFVETYPTSPLGVRAKKYLK